MVRGMWVLVGCYVCDKMVWWLKFNGILRGGVGCGVWSCMHWYEE